MLYVQIAIELICDLKFTGCICQCQINLSKFQSNFSDIYQDNMYHLYCEKIKLKVSIITFIENGIDDMNVKPI